MLHYFSSEIARSSNKYFTFCLVMVTLWCSSALAEVQNCYSCDPDIKNGILCNNPSQFSVEKCPSGKNDACLILHTKDKALERHCTEKEHCSMFPLFEDGECCYTDLCNKQHSVDSKKSIQLIVLVQFGLPIINLGLTALMIVFTVAVKTREAIKQRKNTRSSTSSSSKTSNELATLTKHKKVVLGNERVQVTKPKSQPSPRNVGSSGESSSGDDAPILLIENTNVYAQASKPTKTAPTNHQFHFNPRKTAPFQTIKPLYPLESEV